jgi:hypothetical protein
VNVTNARLISCDNAIEGLAGRPGPCMKIQYSVLCCALSFHVHALI